MHVALLQAPAFVTVPPLVLTPRRVVTPPSMLIEDGLVAPLMSATEVSSTLASYDATSSATLASLASVEPPAVLGAAPLIAIAVFVGFIWLKVARSFGVFVHKDNSPSGFEFRAAERLKNFGMLQADMRVPLPSLEELKTACHQIGQLDGGRVFLCYEKLSAGCVPSPEFSEHYQHDVYVCKPPYSFNM